MNEEELKFMTDCDTGGKCADIEAYRDAIVQYLMRCTWHDSEESARALAEDEAAYIEEAFEKKRPVADVALDIGFACG